MTISTNKDISDSLRPIEDRISPIQHFLENQQLETLLEHIALWSPAEIADSLEALPLPERRLFWKVLSENQKGEVLARLGEQVRVGLLNTLELEDVVAATTSMETPDLAEVVDEAPTVLRDAILDSLAPDDRALVEDTLAFPENSAGRLMERDLVAVRADVTLDVVKRYLQHRGSLPRRTTALMIVDREQRFLGKLPLEYLLTKDTATKVSELMDPNAVSVNVLTPLSEVSHLFQHRDLIALPVVNEEGKLVGRIVFDDAIDLIRTEAEEPMMHMAGLEADEDLLAPITTSTQRRLFWLGINLVTAFMAAAVIGIFESTLDKIVALAVLMPIIASMGGIAGSQTLTLAIRGLALGHITDSNKRWLFKKEIVISVINGIIWAVVVGVIAWLWFNQIGISLVLGAAMIINLAVAAIFGLTIPLVLDKLGIDAALSGSVVLTTVTDVVGFMSFLGLATLFLI